MSRWVQSVLMFGLVLPLGAGCVDPTQIKVAVTTDMDCSGLSQSPETGLTFGDPAVPEGPDQNTTTYECQSREGLDYIGSITAIPRDDDDEALVAIRVMTAVGVQLNACDLLQPGSPCVVARRQLRYIPQTTLNVPIVMREACLGVVCPEGQTCQFGDCVGAQIKSSQCPEGNCGEELLQGPSPGALSTPVQLTSQAGTEDQPHLVWTGTDFALVWRDRRNDPREEIFFARFDENGTKEVSDTLVATTSSSAFPMIAPFGQGFLFSHLEGTQTVRAGQLGASGESLSNYDHTPASDPSIASSATGGVQAMIADGEVQARPFMDGVFLDNRVVTTDADQPANPFVTAASTGFAVAWDDMSSGNRDLWVALLSDTAMTTESVAVTTDPGSSRQPSLAATANGFGLAWVDDRDGNEEIYFAVLDAEGAKLGADVRITHDQGQSTDPQLVRAGSGFGLAWLDVRAGAEQIYFTRLDAQGTRMAELQVTAPSSTSTDPSLAWTGSVFGLAWAENRVDHYDLYFATITPPPPVSQPQ